MKIGDKPMMIYFVYKSDEIVYIGQTIQTLAQRKGKHVSDARLGRGSVIGAGIRKHGEEFFEFKRHSIYYCQVDLDSAEKHYISKYNPRYNLQRGGKSGYVPWNKGKKETRPEVKANISKAAVNRKRTKRGSYTDVHKRKIGDATRKRNAREFICEQNGKTYYNKVTAAKDLGIIAQRVSDVLCPTHSMKSYKGYTFQYID